MLETLKESIKVIELFEQRNRLLTAIAELSSNSPSERGQDEILTKCCEILIQNNDYCLVWAGKRDEEGIDIIPLAAVNSVKIPDRDCMNLIEQVILTMHDTNPAARALITGQPVIIQDILNEEFADNDGIALQNVACKTGFRSCASWPLLHKKREYGVLTIHSEHAHSFKKAELEFLASVTTDISLGLYSHETTSRLQVERDFNQEIVDTIQALMVSISPCGQILSFNSEAERVTGYTQEEVKGKYWVDVLLAPKERKQNQGKVSSALKQKRQEMNFQALLQTKAKEKRIVDWHGSIRPDIKGKDKVGLVMLGLDVTEQLEADQALDQALAQWKNIFSAIQDPALLVNNNNTIVDANLATFTAARKTREEVIGKQACDILHGGRQTDAICPLEVLISMGKSRILETELRGLSGQYLLTVSPLVTSQDKLTLLIAREMSEEERLKAEAVRAAQLASIGELAAGVAHEINNPINGIINYAQLILDDMDVSAPNAELLQRIINEGKRVGTIAHKLLDFARQGKENMEPFSLIDIVNDSIDLVGHQLKKDGIITENNIADTLPLVWCNSQQIQQVLLNILSNARYALNERFAVPDPDKKILLSTEEITVENNPYIRLTITDHGTGIAQDIMNRLLDPFFSTKPKGQGTGLGLSISHGIIKDNNGFLRIESELGTFTSLIIELPVAEQ